MIGTQSEPHDLDFPGFAQEFLRRNPAYARDYRKIMHSAAPEHSLAQEEMARSWGLSFPLLA